MIHPSRGAWTAALAATALLLAAGSAAARMPFDGNWSVSIWTDKGPCDRGYRYELRVDRGQVFYRGREAFDVSGRVDGSGRVRVTVSRGDRSAWGTGRLSRNYGRGVWRGKGSTQQCSGVWEAERRPG